jgi:acetyl esterase/lipase
LQAVVAVCLVSISIHRAAAARADDAYEITPDVVYGHKAGMALTFDVIRPKQPNGAAVLFMMSGGWFSGWVPPEGFVSPAAPDGFKHFREMVDHGYTLFIVRHGSAPQFKVPEAVADVRRAVRYIRLNAAKLGIEQQRIGVCGGSAGGHLSLILGTASDEGDKNAKDEIDRTSDRVAAVVAYFPPVDLREWVGTKIDRFPALDFDKKLADSVSPMLHVSSDDPPTLLIHGDKDDLVKLDNSERILAELKQENVPCELLVIEGAGHGFLGEQGKKASTALLAWFDKHLAAPDVVATAGAESGVRDDPDAEVPGHRPQQALSQPPTTERIMNSSQSTREYPEAYRPRDSSSAAHRAAAYPDRKDRRSNRQSCRVGRRTSRGHRAWSCR